MSLHSLQLLRAPLRRVAVASPMSNLIGEASLSTGLSDSVHVLSRVLSPDSTYLRTTIFKAMSG